jgi:hypothetical protein
MIPLQKDRVTIFVELLDEGVKCWRPVSADRVSEDTYRIVGSVPQGEVWLFQPGEIVRCTQRQFSDGTGLTAYESVASI